ncbi:DNA-processing protein DprA [Thioclava atlantica]|uniref:DNA protecting protein DprA n=1 Tax=Thioclava atlantica TaxID=1317124 RepID=A0A085TY26_9RHOB|nr:DNA-processing protein DprA [Thioclava atlantica]KFE35623.1 DNA protecting protein DprA [Thioclava atlantica]
MKTDLFSYPTPFTPPTTEEDELSVLRLIRSRRVGPATFHRLMREHGSAAAALEALPEVARAAGVSDYAPCPEAAAKAELKAGKHAGARLLLFGTPDYPAALAQIEDAPPVLWALGRIELLTRPMVALVGARNASSLGLRMAHRLATGLGEAGICVVSGLARGIDAAAHQAALETGTIGVQAGGIDVIYPQENTELARRMAEEGLRLSEAPPGIQPQARHFPQRNRIISGLAAGVVVVEAALKSGSLITARDALDQGREVMAVPGHPMDGRAGGCNLLIRDGAILVRGAEDVLSALQATRVRAEAASPSDPAPRKVPRDEAAITARILDRLGPSPSAEDQLIRDLGIDAALFSRLLTTLEIDGRIERHRGGLISRPA